MCLFLPPPPFPPSSGSLLMILKGIFDPLLLFCVMWPALSLQPGRLLIRPVKLLFERHIEPSKGFLLKVKFWMMFKASPGKLPTCMVRATCDIPAWVRTVIFFVKEMIFCLYNKTSHLP